MKPNVTRDYIREKGISIKELGEYLNVPPRRISVQLCRGLNKTQEAVIKNAVDALAEKHIQNNVF